MVGTLFIFALVFGSSTLATNQQFGDQSFSEYEAYLHPSPELGLATRSKVVILILSQ